MVEFFLFAGSSPIWLYCAWWGYFCIFRKFFNDITWHCIVSKKKKRGGWLNNDEVMINRQYGESLYYVCYVSMSHDKLIIYMCLDFFFFAMENHRPPFSVLLRLPQGCCNYVAVNIPKLPSFITRFTAAWIHLFSSFPFLLFPIILTLCYSVLQQTKNGPSRSPDLTGSVVIR